MRQVAPRQWIGCSQKKNKLSDQVTNEETPSTHKSHGRTTRSRRFYLSPTVMEITCACETLHERRHHSPFSHFKSDPHMNTAIFFAISKCARRQGLCEVEPIGTTCTTKGLQGKQCTNNLSGTYSRDWAGTASLKSALAPKPPSAQMHRKVL